MVKAVVLGASGGIGQVWTIDWHDESKLTWTAIVVALQDLSTH